MINKCIVRKVIYIKSCVLTKCDYHVKHKVYIHCCNFATR